MLKDNRDPFELRLEIIRSMPEGPEKEQALEQLFRDYPGEVEDLESKRDQGFKLATGGIAQGTIAGPASNPYTQYVAASPFEHAANAMKTYQGFKSMKESDAGLKEIRDQKKDAAMNIGQAALQKETASQLRDPEEEERKRRQLMMMAQYYGGNT